MDSVKLEPRPLYAIGTVARLTGLKSDTLRVWERRYGLGASFRSPTGRRQYTQADMEHMQLVAALVNSGVRIGEIAACGRKTLEIMVRRLGDDVAEVVERKPRVVAVGVDLCKWLDEHQGCLSHVDASLARCSLVEAELAIAGVQPPHLLVIGCEGLAFAQVRQVKTLVAALRPERTLVVHLQSGDSALKALRENGIGTTAFPPDPGFLAFELTRLSAELSSRQGRIHLGDLVRGRPRHLSGEELLAASVSQAGADEIHPARVAALVNELLGLEEDIASGAVVDWSDAAVHACAYAYAGQARWLMEKALQIVLAPQDLAGAEPSPTDQTLHNAA